MPGNNKLDPDAVTYLGGPFELVPVIRDILRTRYCVPGSVFLVEGIDRVAVSQSGRWQAVRLLLGDGVLCLQAILGADMHRFIQTGEVGLGSYIRCKSLFARQHQPQPAAEADDSNSRPIVYLVVEDLVPVGWNESYRTRQGEEPPEPKASAPPKYDSSAEHAAAEEVFDEFETLAYPEKKKTGSEAVPKPRASDPASASAAASTSKLKDGHRQQQQQQPIAMARDWHDPRQPLKLTTLHSIPHLPYAQNWSCNVLAIVTELSPVEPSNLAPHRQRTARLADPSTAKRVHLTVFLDPDDFAPQLGSPVLLVGVKNHRFDGGSLKKYASDRRDGAWWFENPEHLDWCDVAGIKAWWAEVTASTSSNNT